MIRKLLKHLLAPVMREVIQENESQNKERTTGDIRQQVIETPDRVCSDYEGTPI
jgi:hypothetical protein